MRVLPALVLALLLAACSEPDYWAFSSRTSPGPNQGLTIVAIWISDSPVDALESAFVTVDRVELDGVALATAPRELDLLALQNGVRALLAERDVAPGTYDRLRIRLAPAGHRVVRAGGVTEPLQAVGTLIEVAGPFRLRADERLELQVDFNVRLSVTEAGGVWRLDPQAVALDPRDAAAIEGMVTDAAGQPLALATVSAQLGGHEVASTRTAPDGSFRLGPVPASTYTVAVTAPGFAPAVDFAVAAPSTGNGFVLAASAVGTLTGTAPVGATVARLERNGVLIALAGVDPFGAYSFDSVPAGSYDLRIGGTVTPVLVR
jgi:hypothetical protein